MLDHPEHRERIERAAWLDVRQAQSLFLGSLLIATTMFAWAATRPLDWLLVVVPDDTYYYLGIARHLAESGRPTFDGVQSTNGYHPGWMLVSVACAAMFDDSVALLRSVLVCAFGFHVAACVVLVKAARQVMSDAAAWTAGALWMLSLLPLRLAIQGMEASFYIFCMSLALFVYLTRFHGRTEVPGSDLVALGLVLSLCFWGRTEALVLAASVILAVGFRLRLGGGLRPLLLMSLAFAVGAVPWLAYSYATTGRVLQQSGAMKLLWGSEALPMIGERLWAGALYLLGTWISLPLLGALDAEAGGWRGALNVLVLVAVFVLLARGMLVSRTRALAMIGFVLLGATLATGAVYAWFFADRQFWYKAQPGFVLYLVLFFGIAELAARRSRSFQRTVVISVAALHTLALAWQLSSLSTYPWQRDVYYSQRRFESLVPEGEKIGCFNAGIPGYFSHRRIINLDGLVNNAIVDHYRHRTVDDYLIEAQIRYIADEAYTLARSFRFMDRPPAMAILATATLTGSGTPTRYLWRLTFSSDSTRAMTPHEQR